VWPYRRWWRHPGQGASSASPGTCCSPARSGGPTCPVAACPRWWPPCGTRSCRSRTRPWCCPATGRSPASAVSAPTTRTCARWRPVRPVPVRGRLEDGRGMSRPRPLSGFPEWLPGQRIIEQQIVDRVRRSFELHGFAPVETRAVEPLEQLLRKGETSQEVYVLRRLQADPDAAAEAQLGLHFDLTVPFARYVLENAGKLVFPLRRYQIQKVWRGERPQEGRYREFRQADIDVVDRDTLPLHHDVEVVLAAADTLSGLPVPAVTIRTNNRKVCEGFYRGIGIADPPAALRAVDKLDKIGPDGVAALLSETAGATDAQAKACLALGEISTADASFVARVQALGVSDPLLDEGLAELVSVVEAAAEHTPGVVVADLSIARGLD